MHHVIGWFCLLLNSFGEPSGEMNATEQLPRKTFFGWESDSGEKSKKVGRFAQRSNHRCNVKSSSHV